MTVYSYHSLILMIVKDLFSAETDRLKKNVERIVKRNMEATGDNTPGFIWDGDFYSIPGLGVNQKFARRSLHLSLESEMKVHVKDARIIAEDKHEISQILYKTMSACDSNEEMRNALPNCVTNLIPGLKDIPRTDEPGCCFKEGSRDLRQFNKVVNKLDEYAAGKLFY